MKKLYIVTRPTRSTDLDFDDLSIEEGENDDEWKEKARRLQVRRWRKIKHQLV